MDISGIKYLGIDRVLKRGTGEIIADLDNALLVAELLKGYSRCTICLREQTKQ